MAEPVPRLKVLVVEDEGVLSGYIEDVLEGACVDVVGVATTGAEALEMAERTRPDLVLVDLALGGGMDGMETARLLRVRFGAALVLVNGAGTQEVQARVAELAPLGVLHSPFLPRHLLRVLHTVGAELRP